MFAGLESASCSPGEPGTGLELGPQRILKTAQGTLAGGRAEELFSASGDQPRSRAVLVRQSCTELCPGV